MRELPTYLTAKEVAEKLQVPVSLVERLDVPVYYKWSDIHGRRDIQVRDKPKRHMTKRQLENSCVYVVMREDVREVKIGWSTNLETRLRDLETAHGQWLELLVAIPGGPEEEEQLHERFKQHRLGGEWFTADPEILEWAAKELRMNPRAKR